MVVPSLCQRVSDCIPWKYSPEEIITSRSRRICCRITLLYQRCDRTIDQNLLITMNVCHSVLYLVWQWLKILSKSTIATHVLINIFFLYNYAYENVLQKQRYVPGFFSMQVAHLLNNDPRERENLCAEN